MDREGVAMIQDRPIAEDLDDQERDKLYKSIVGGVAWPAKHPGYAIVLGCARETLHSPWCAYAVDEFESYNINELVHQCCVLDQKWNPDRWLGDPDNDAAFEVMVRANKKYAEQNRRWLGLKLSPPLTLEHKRPYQYMHTQLLHLMNKKRTRLYLKSAIVRNYMSLLLPADIPILQFGDFPHIEALAYAATDIFRVNESKLTPPSDKMRRAPMRY